MFCIPVIEQPPNLAGSNAGVWPAVNFTINDIKSSPAEPRVMLLQEIPRLLGWLFEVIVHERTIERPLLSPVRQKNCSGSSGPLPIRVTEALLHPPFDQPSGPLFDPKNQMPR